mgnify:CR=1 FL=1
MLCLNLVCKKMAATYPVTLPPDLQRKRGPIEALTVLTESAASELDFQEGVTKAILKGYLLSLLTSNPSCDTCGGPQTVSSKSGQDILICRDSVFKGAARTQLRIKPKGTEVALDPYSMNRLVQSAVRALPSKISRRVEHYTQICSQGDKVYLKGPAYRFHGFSSVEDFILGVIAGKHLNNTGAAQASALLLRWAKTLTTTLDMLYNSMQFHHCDPKAAQLFLNTQGQVIVGDLDKVTFTLVVGGLPRRMVLTKTAKTGLTGRAKDSLVAVAEKANQLSAAESMRFESMPRRSNVLEKAAFIASMLVLTQNPKVVRLFRKAALHSPELQDVVSQIDFRKLRRAMREKNSKGLTSHKTAVGLVKQQKPVFASKLTSQAVLDSPQLRVTPTKIEDIKTKTINDTGRKEIHPSCD